MRCHQDDKCRPSGLFVGSFDVVQDMRTMLLWFGVRTLSGHSSSIKVVLPGRDPQAMSLSSSKDFRITI